MDRFGRGFHHRGPRPEEEDEDEEDEDEEPQQFRGPFGGRHHKRGGHHGGRWGHQGRHQGQPRVESEEDESDETVIIAGTPVKASAAKKFYGGHGRHGKHGGKSHGCKFARLGRILPFVLMMVHFWFIKGLKQAQEAVEAITGVKDDGWKCGWKKHHKKKVVAQVVTQQPVQQSIFIPAQQQPVVYDYSQINTESSINTEAPEIFEERDKEMGYTFVPTPVAGTITVNNTMA